jgi:hypothetical protein
VCRLPTFFIAGAPKTGTTSLYHYLGQHPQIYMSPIKEPHFFAEEVRVGNMDAGLLRRNRRDASSLRKFLSGTMREQRFGGIVENWEDYQRLFANAKDESALGEASACYLWSPTAPVGIYKRIPGAKIVVMLRDPAERAFSQYLQGLSMGAIRWTFREHITRSLRNHSSRLSLYHPFLEFGLYCEQIQRYRERFGPNVWIGFYEDFKACAPRVCQEIFRFLGIAADFSPDTRRRYLAAQVPRVSAAAWLRQSGIWEAAARITPRSLRPLFRRMLIRDSGAAMEPGDRRYLLDFYREEIRKVETLAGRSLDHWLETGSAA